MDHLSRAGEKLGISKASDEASQILIQNKMMEDQGVDKTESNRWLLGLATWVPWEIYMCLLYAEVEHYVKVSRQHPSLSYAPIEDYMASHDAVVDSLREVRYSILHPLKQTTTEINLRRFLEVSGQIAPDPLLPLVALQNSIDDYLEWFRDSLGESIVDEMVSHSDDEIYEFNRIRMDRVTSFVPKTESAEVKAAARKWLDGLQESTASLGLNVGAHVALTSSQQRRIERWDRTTDTLAKPLPQRPYLKSGASVQTPVHREWWSFVPASPAEGQPAWTGDELPEYVQRNRSGFIDLLVRSLIIANEPYTATVSGFESTYADRSRADVLSSDHAVQELVQDILTRETNGSIQQAELLTSPMAVSVALLAEPLRVYMQVTSTRHELKRGEIESRVGVDSLAAFLRHRNVVFHVPDDRTDVFKASEEFHSKLPSLGFYREIVGELFRFYLRNPTGT